MEREIKTEDLTELIDFTTILQLFNMEKKSLVLGAKVGNEVGYVAFDNGEIIDAGLNDLRGVEAFQKIILENPKKFKIVKTKKKVPRTIEIPFMNLLLESVKNVDELHKETKSWKPEEKGVKNKNTKENPVSIEKLFNEKFVSALDEIKGFSGCFVVNKRGIWVWKHYQYLSDIKFSFSLAHRFFQQTQKTLLERFSWQTRCIILYLKKKILFLKAIKINGIVYTLILILDSSGNEAMAKRALKMLDRSLAV